MSDDLSCWLWVAGWLGGWLLDHNIASPFSFFHFSPFVFWFFLFPHHNNTILLTYCAESLSLSVALCPPLSTHTTDILKTSLTPMRSATGSSSTFTAPRMPLAEKQRKQLCCESDRNRNLRNQESFKTPESCLALPSIGRAPVLTAGRVAAMRVCVCVCGNSRDFLARLLNLQNFII